MYFLRKAHYADQVRLVKVEPSFFKHPVPRRRRGQYRRSMRERQGDYDDTSGAYHDLRETGDAQQG
jgi:hypothetical protein